MIFRMDLKKLIISLAVPLAAGGLSALITGPDMEIYGRVKQPPLSPPGILFPIVWTVLYLLMGISLYLAWTAKVGPEEKRQIWIRFLVQLLLNFIWSPFFFIARQYFAAFLVLLALLVAVVGWMVSLRRCTKTAFWLQIPYVIWLLFAAYLNFGVYWLNR